MSADNVFIITAEGEVQGVCLEEPPKGWYGKVKKVLVWDTVEEMYEDLGEEPNPRRR